MVYPVPDQKSERIVKLLAEEAIPLCGDPEALQSDRGTNLVVTPDAYAVPCPGIKKLNTTAYHMQCRPVGWSGDVGVRESNKVELIKSGGGSRRGHSPLSPS